MEKKYHFKKDQLHPNLLSGLEYLWNLISPYKSRRTTKAIFKRKRMQCWSSKEPRATEEKNTRKRRPALSTYVK